MIVYFNTQKNVLYDHAFFQTARNISFEIIKQQILIIAILVFKQRY